MGRETKILLSLLGLLTGTFLAVLSAKLLVPRPPAGTGPDVHAVVAVIPQSDLVEPPALLLSRTIAVETPPVAPPKTLLVADEPMALPPPTLATLAAPPLRKDPFVAPTSLQNPEVLAVAETVSELPSVDTTKAVAILPTGFVAGSTIGSHRAVAGDSWWLLAEKAYGDGRLYRALFAWNRALDPRVSLIPGTQLEVPTRAKLTTAWPKLVPLK